MNFQFADALGTRRTEVSAAGVKALQLVGSYQSLPFGVTCPRTTQPGKSGVVS
jgi:hypothetical protein